MNHLRHAKGRAQLRILGLTMTDAELFFKIMANAAGSNSVEIKAFVNGCMKLRGQASSLDAQTLLFFSRLQAERQNRTLELVTQIQQELADIEFEPAGQILDKSH